MNKLAQIVHDLMTGTAQLDAKLLSGLSPQERAALQDLRPLLTKSPSELADLVAQEGPTTVWFGPPPAADQPAAS